METARFDRAEAWRLSLGSAFGELAPESFGELAPESFGDHGRGEPAGPTGTMAGAQLGEVLAFEVSGTPQILRRSPRAVGRVPIDLLKVCVQLRGRATIHQGSREIVLEPGQLAIYDTGRSYDLRLEENWSCAVMAFPRESLGLPWRSVAHAMERAFPADRGPGAVLSEFVATSVAQAGAFHRAGALRLGEAGLSLLAGTLCDQPVLQPDGSADVVREQILTHIRTHLTDPHLTRNTVAAAFGMSPRTLNRLFADEAWTVADHIRRLRLEAARRDLSDPQLRHRSIAIIAAQWCFVDAAHFSRVFRAEFGTSPSQVRDQA